MCRRNSLLAVLFGTILQGNILNSFLLIRSCHGFTFLPSQLSYQYVSPYRSIERSTVLRATTEYNAVPVAKTGGRGVMSTSQDALEKNLSLGAPGDKPLGGHFLTRGGVQITAHVTPLHFLNEEFIYPIERAPLGSSARALEDLIDQLDTSRGVLLSSSYEYPGRYARWSLGFVNPPLEVSGTGQTCFIRALNSRGMVLLPAVAKAMRELHDAGVVDTIDLDVEGQVEVKVAPLSAVGSFSEEERSRQPSLFAVVRALVDLFGYDNGDGQLGLYGSFGYDLTFQFEPIKLAQTRDPEQRDLLLYLPDQIVVIDQDKRDAWTISYDFFVDGKSTQGLPRDGKPATFKPFDEKDMSMVSKFNARDTPPHEFSKAVERAKGEFKVGNLFEVVLSQTFREKLGQNTPPSTLFRRLRSRNPSPYGFFINLGEDEFLVGASPEMFVRCEKTRNNDYRSGAIRVETCPISGTVARGIDALEDAKRVRSLIMNQKEESELTMCTDVDRNDKSRICEPGSVKVIGRRQIEMYSRLIHTVDHVEGYLREKFDALDAFLCHTWAVTVTGAPKTWAIQFVENNERSPRCWYGGAVGLIGFDGSLNTGLTLRTVRVKKGVAEVRAGATLLYDSDPTAEELETELKASAMIDAIVQDHSDLANTDAGPASNEPDESSVGKGKKIILIDHEDSFVHTLGNYLRQTGAEVTTLRSGPSSLHTIQKMSEEGHKPDMVVLSPGPGNPSDFGLSKSLSLMGNLRIPVFGVCLGLQGMVEHFGGELGVLGYPMHGKPSPVFLTKPGQGANSIFDGLPQSFEVARYHSLHGLKDKMPSCLEITAITEDGIVMGIQHKTLPIAGVQFHPESILTSPVHGMTILKNALKTLKYNDHIEQSNSESQHESNHQIPSTTVDTNLPLSDLKKILKAAGLTVSGTKDELTDKLIHWVTLRDQHKAGTLVLDQMTVNQLKDLKHQLGLKGATNTKDSLVQAVRECLTSN